MGALKYLTIRIVEETYEPYTNNLEYGFPDPGFTNEDYILWAELEEQARHEEDLEESIYQMMREEIMQ